MDTLVIDARRLLCPLPVIRVQDAIPGLPAGTQIEVQCTDPGAMHDIPAWCRIHGHLVLRTQTDDGIYRIFLEVSTHE